MLISSRVSLGGATASSHLLTREEDVHTVKVSQQPEQECNRSKHARAAPL